jgi:T5SS/PEP-CTERM-associated repeat protein
MRVTNRGAVATGVGYLGATAVGIGTATIDGAGSRWTNTGSLFVGYEGQGTLTLSNGAAASTLQAILGRSPGSTGTVHVSGTDSNWTIHGRLSIGGDVTTGISGGAGLLHVQAGGRVNVAQDVSIFPGGVVNLGAGTLDAREITLQPSAQFHWTAGTLHTEIFNGNLLNQAGTLAPGHSAGDLVIHGNYTQQSNGVMEIEIGGTGMGSQYDFINVTGNALLDGRLQLALIDGFVPSAGQTFLVFNATSLLGVFDNAGNNQRVTTVDGGGSFVVHYGVGSTFDPKHIVLSDFQAVTLPGDYNQNGVVDAPDYVLWRNTLGQAGAGLAADGSANGVVDQVDYDLWKSRYGALAGFGRTTNARNNVTAPEPSTVALLVVCAGLISIVQFGRDGSTEFRDDYTYVAGT